MELSTNILAVGIDPAKKDHYGVAIVFPEVILLSRFFSNSFDGIKGFYDDVTKLAQEYGLKPIYGLEDVGIYGKGVKDLLLDWQCEVVEVNPVKTNRQKDFYGQDKSDEISARCVAAIVLRSLPDLPVIKRTGDLLKTIREVARERERLVKTQTQNINRLHSRLTQVYLGVYQDLFPSLKGKVALEFFARYPTPQALKGETEESLADFLRQASNGRYKGKARSLAQRILAGVKGLLNRPSTSEQDLAGRQIQHLSVMIKETGAMITEIEEYLEQLEKQCGEKITSFPGLKTALAGVILGETGEVNRFGDRNGYARYNGTAPCEDSSGQTERWVANKRCNRRLKRAFYILALTAARCNPISRCYYQRLLSRGLSKTEALKRVARRLSDIIFAMMRNDTAYDPEVVLIKMQRRQKGEVAISRFGGLEENHRRNNEPSLTLSQIIYNVEKNQGGNFGY